VGQSCDRNTTVELFRVWLASGFHRATRLGSSNQRKPASISIGSPEHGLRTKLPSHYQAGNVPGLFEMSTGKGLRQRRARQHATKSEPRYQHGSDPRCGRLCIRQSSILPVHNRVSVAARPCTHVRSAPDVCQNRGPGRSPTRSGLAVLPKTATSRPRRENASLIA
jgi:hypothetical protein